MTSLRQIQAHGACRGVNDPNFWAVDDDVLPTTTPDPVVAATCWRCPIRVDCLEWALENEADEGEAGVWGGMTPFQRRQLKKDRSRVKCPGCGSTSVVVMYNSSELCVSCGITWSIGAR